MEILTNISSFELQISTIVSCIKTPFCLQAEVDYKGSAIENKTELWISKLKAYAPVINDEPLLR